MRSKGTEYRIGDGIQNWTGLRSIGNSTFSKLTMLVPVFGYFIIFNDNVARYLHLVFDVCQPNECQISWRWFLIYFGLCFVAMGAFIFSARCPDIVKRYSTSRDFFESSRLFYAHPHNLSWLLDDIATMSGSPYRDVMELDSLAARGGGIGAEQVHMLSGPMAAYYNLKNRSRTRWRRGCLAFYGLGAALLSVPTLLTFAEVVAVAVHRFTR